MKKFRSLLFTTCLCMAFAACKNVDPPKSETLPGQNDPTTAITTTAAPQADTTAAATEKTETATAPTDAPETAAPIDPSEIIVSIELKDGATKVTGDTTERVFVEGNVIIIQKAGTYELTGTLTDGQIRIEAGKEDKVELVLRGVDVTNKSGAALYSVKADKTILEVKNETTNRFTDAKEYKLPDGEDEPNACIFSKGDLTLKGKGTLIVTGNYNNGIACKDDLKITNGIINVTAAKNGIRGNDSITVKGAAISVTCGKDAFKVTTEDKEDKGFFLMEDGEVTVVAGDDAIQSTRSITVSGGTFTYTAEGKKAKCDGTVEITEGTMIKK